MLSCCTPKAILSLHHLFTLLPSCLFPSADVFACRRNKGGQVQPPASPCVTHSLPLCPPVRGKSCPCLWGCAEHQKDQRALGDLTPWVPQVGATVTRWLPPQASSCLASETTSLSFNLLLTSPSFPRSILNRRIQFLWSQKFVQFRGPS